MSVSCIDVTVRIYLLGIQFPDEPSSHFAVEAFRLIAGLSEDHSQPIERHRFFDGALDDEFIADLGGGHEGAIAFGGDVEIDGKELLFVRVLRYHRGQTNTGSGYQ